MAEAAPKSSYSMDPILYLYTSLTAGSSHIITATSRMETILRANKIPFKGVDLATDEKARMLWGRRAGKDESGRVRKLPGLVQMGLVVGVCRPCWQLVCYTDKLQDIVEVEDWNEYGELKLHIKIVPLDGSPAPKPAAKAGPSKISPKAAPKSNENVNPAATKPLPAKSSETKAPEPAATGNTTTIAMRSIGEEAAQKAKEIKKASSKILSGKGQSDPVKAMSNSAVIPPPIVTSIPKNESDTTNNYLTAMQSPTTSCWNRTAEMIETAAPSTPFSKEEPKEESSDILASMQSPTSTAWKPAAEITVQAEKPVVATHRGSSISEASKEEIEAVERELTIQEEDENAVED